MSQPERRRTDNSGRVVRILNGPRSFKPEWVAEGAKQVVPLASHTGMDRHLARRLSEGASRAGHTHVIANRLSNADAERADVEIPATQEHILRQLPWRDASFLVALPDLSGALLVTDEGYALLAGNADFLRHSLPEGVDQAIVDFKRYAKRLGRDHPGLVEAAMAFQPHQMAWASKRDVAAGSATAEQVSLMESLVNNRVSGEEFARSWLSARRRALELHERLREPFSRILDQVFYALDDYVIDPRLRDEDDMTNEQLRAIVRQHLAELDALDRRTA